MRKTIRLQKRHVSPSLVDLRKLRKPKQYNHPTCVNGPATVAETEKHRLQKQHVPPLCIAIRLAAKTSQTAKTTCPTFVRGPATVAKTNHKLKKHHVLPLCVCVWLALRLSPQQKKTAKQHELLCVALRQSRKPSTHCNNNMSHHCARPCDYYRNPNTQTAK